MPDTSLPLIVGAGPVGKAAALFLARAGVATRVIDRASEPSANSKALAVNPRTLELLEPTGVTEQMLARGLRITGACLWRDGRIAAQADFGDLPHRYPFMLALSQATTEQLLEQALVQQGGSVERATALVHCRNVGDAVEAQLDLEAHHPPQRARQSAPQSAPQRTPQLADDSAVAQLPARRPEAMQTITCPWLLAADGAHSTARHVLNLPFPGSDFARPWRLADLPLTTSLDPMRAHVGFFDNGGFIFLLRVVSDLAAETADASTPPLWRIISNRPDALERFAPASPAGPPVWTSTFRIAHRIVDTMTAGRVHFAGDAAHIHSPMGARGMNLGIEDAWFFAQCVRADKLDRYGPTRRAIDHRVVRRVEWLTRAVRGESAASRLLRALLPPLLARAGFIRPTLFKTLAGLDHSIAGP